MTIDEIVRRHDQADRLSNIVADLSVVVGTDPNLRQKITDACKKSDDSVYDGCNVLERVADSLREYRSLLEGVMNETRLKWPPSCMQQEKQG